MKWTSRCPQRSQMLSQNDRRFRAHYCNLMKFKLRDDPSFLDFVIWSDEAIFKLNGQMRRNAVRYWSDGTNKKVYPRRNSQDSLMVLVAIWPGGIIGPFFFSDLPRIQPRGRRESITHEKYLQMLHSYMLPELEEQIPMDDPEIRRKVWFQLDGAPIHTANNVKEFLDVYFPRQWIGNGGHIAWPPNSPDLTPLDFSFWGELKRKVFRRSPSTKVAMKQAIIEECATFTLDYLNNICIKEVIRRFYLVCERNGDYIEQL